MTQHVLSGSSSPVRIPSTYTDINGHLNIGYYSVLFDQALVRPYYNGVGVGKEMILKEGKTTFALESHFTYQREVKASDLVCFGLRLLDLDSKRAHLFLTMNHAEEGWVAATHETLSMCVDVKSRKSAEWPPWVASRLSALLDEHRGAPVPAEAGRVIRIRRKP